MHWSDGSLCVRFSRQLEGETIDLVFYDQGEKGLTTSCAGAVLLPLHQNK